MLTSSVVCCSNFRRREPARSNLGVHTSQPFTMASAISTIASLFGTTLHDAVEDNSVAHLTSCVMPIHDFNTYMDLVADINMWSDVRRDQERPRGELRVLGNEQQLVAASVSLARTLLESRSDPKPRVPPMWRVIIDDDMVVVLASTIFLSGLPTNARARALLRSCITPSHMIVALAREMENDEAWRHINNVREFDTTIEPYLVKMWVRALCVHVHADVDFCADEETREIHIALGAGSDDDRDG
jgi:hypothetical protein